MSGAIMTDMEDEAKGLLQCVLGWIDLYRNLAVHDYFEFPA